MQELERMPSHYLELCIHILWGGGGFRGRDRIQLHVPVPSAGADPGLQVRGGGT